MKYCLLKDISKTLAADPPLNSTLSISTEKNWLVSPQDPFPEGMWRQHIANQEQMPLLEELY